MNDTATKFRVETFAACLFLVFASSQSLGFFGDKGPSILAPWPALLSVPLLLGFPGPVLVLVPVVALLIWCPKLFNGSAQIPKRTFIAVPLLAVISIGWFITSWGFGMEYQGSSYTYGMAGMNLLVLVALSILLARMRRTETFRANLTVHLLLFGWLVTFALPYFGEAM